MEEKMKQSITVLSLFDGMSCGQLALQRAGINVKKYYASEIDKHAIKVTQHNFPQTIQLGDVTKLSGFDLPKIDLVVGGSPCQGFSFAGKGLNFEDERSKLFFEYVRLVKECNPKWFMLENVKMLKEHELVISRFMKVAPIEINSALVSAQNRERLYWTNIAQRPDGLFGDLITDIPQPKDKRIFLKDILENDVAEKYFLSEKMLEYFRNRVSKLASSASIDVSDNFIAVVNDNGTLRDKGDKSTCIDHNYSKGVDNHGARTMIVASRGRNPQRPTSRESGLETEQMLEPRFDGKTNCLTGVQKDNLVQIGNIYDNKHNSVSGRVYTDKGKNVTLSALGGDGGAKTGLYEMKAGIRKLTPVECERLQTVPDNYTSCVSDTQRYRMLGNGWTVDVVAYIFSFLKNEIGYEEK